MLKVFVASESGKYIGYCIASIEEDAGEIESIFINPEFRNRKTGHLLMDAALKWWEEQACETIDLIVAEGNESVIYFYKT